MNRFENILIGDVIYIVGHRHPDMDAVVAAHAYQAYRHTQGDFNYIAIRCDEPNEVTKWAYKRWELEMPPLVDDISNRNVVLIDHTDPEQRPKGWENSDIIEAVDHHKLNLETSSPPKITVRPYGSTSTLVSQKMMRREVNIDKQLAGLMLSAIIDDTLALRSPITTQIDKQMAGYLASIAGISNLSDYARELFAQKDVWHKMGAEQVCTTDYKDFNMGKLRVRVAQVETMDNRKLESKLLGYQNFMQGARVAEGIDVYLTMITDLIRNDCVLLVSADEKQIKDLEKIFSTKMSEQKTMHLPGVVSRKKQVVPFLVEKWAPKAKA